MDSGQAAIGVDGQIGLLLGIGDIYLISCCKYKRLGVANIRLSKYLFVWNIEFIEENSNLPWVRPSRYGIILSDKCHV